LTIFIEKKKITLIVINYSKILLIVSNNINTSIKNNLSFVNLIKIYLVVSTIIKMYLASIIINFRILNYWKIDFVLLRAYQSCTSNLDSMHLERIYYYIRYAQEANILSIIFDMFDERALRTIMLVIFDKRARRVINIFLVYRNLNTTFL